MMDLLRRIHCEITALAALAVTGMMIAPCGAAVALPTLTSTPVLLAARSAGSDALPALAVRNEVLLRFDRLVPASAPPEEITSLASALAEPVTAERDTALKAMTAGYPAADDLTFDGEKYLGGNFAFIDSVIGMTGRPIALDRALPFLLVPLSPAGETALGTQHDKFQAAKSSVKTLEATAKVLAPSGGDGVAAAGLLFADGSYVRTYCGRFDDLYFHLYQNGNGLSAVAFQAIADGLTLRRYHPLTGLVPATLAPEARFDLSDILSNGGRAAICQWQASQGDLSGRALAAFSYRVLPHISARVAAAKPGTSITVSQQEFAEALSSRRAMYPMGVPPLYRSASRFFGDNAGHMIVVANHTAPTVSKDQMDSLYPLPEPEFPGTDDPARVDQKSSAQLFSSSTASDITWEDPGDSKLLSDSDAPGGQSSPTPTAPQETDPRSLPAERHLIAVVTATAAEATDYFAAIKASDEKLRENERIDHRLRSVQAGLTAADLSTTPTAATTVKADLATLTSLIAQSASERLTLLRERLAIRTELETRIRGERLDALKSFEAAPGNRAMVPKI
ncbi:MAG: hypothetical protein QM796_13035 [Chthoniobacteraceae bacterium]